MWRGGRGCLLTIRGGQTNQSMNQLFWRMAPARPTFTEKQGQYLAFIYAYGRNT